jgi:hypothetical protein
MPLRYWIRIVESVFVVVLAITLLVSWRADRRDRAQLASELAATKQLVAAADAQQHERDARLAESLTALAAQKRAVATPAQIIRELPREIGLPAPIVLQSSPAVSAAQNQTGEPATEQAIIPAEDLKPLYDFTIDCKACQAKLAAAQGDLIDEKNKTAALTKERDEVVRMASGGSAWRRISRAAKWFLIGAAAGAGAAKAAH